jgi:hypothetical protein
MSIGLLNSSTYFVILIHMQTKAQVSIEIQ